MALESVYIMKGLDWDKDIVFLQFMCIWQFLVMFLRPQMAFELCFYAL